MSPPYVLKVVNIASTFSSFPPTISPHGQFLNLSFVEFLLWLSRLRTQRGIHKDRGLIPGLTQWIKDRALPQAAA